MIGWYSPFLFWQLKLARPTSQVSPSSAHWNYCGPPVRVSPKTLSRAAITHPSSRISSRGLFTTTSHELAEGTIAVTATVLNTAALLTIVAALTIGSAVPGTAAAVWTAALHDRWCCRTHLSSRTTSSPTSSSQPPSPLPPPQTRTGAFLTRYSFSSLLSPSAAPFPSITKYIWLPCSPCWV